MITWVNRDLWAPIWPNLAAQAVLTIPVLAWHHSRIRRHIDRLKSSHGQQQR